MGFHDYKGSLIEVAVLSDGKEGSDGWVVEFWDMTPGGKGELLHVYTDANGKYYVDRFEELSDDFVDWAIALAKSKLDD